VAHHADHYLYAHERNRILEGVPMPILADAVDRDAEVFTQNRDSMLEQLRELNRQLEIAVAGGGPKAAARHRKRGKLLARERIALLVDPGAPFLELSALAGWGSEFTVGASLICGIGVVSGVECMVVANDPTVRGGTSNPYTLRKVGRAL